MTTQTNRTLLDDYNEFVATGSTKLLLHESLKSRMKKAYFWGNFSIWLCTIAAVFHCSLSPTYVELWDLIKFGFLHFILFGLYMGLIMMPFKSANRRSTGMSTDQLQANYITFQMKGVGYAQGDTTAINATDYTMTVFDGITAKVEVEIETANGMVTCPLEFKLTEQTLQVKYVPKSPSLPITAVAILLEGETEHLGLAISKETKLDAKFIKPNLSKTILGRDINMSNWTAGVCGVLIFGSFILSIINVGFWYALHTAISMATLCYATLLTVKTFRWFTILWIPLLFLLVAMATSTMFFSVEDVIVAALG